MSGVREGGPGPRRGAVGVQRVGDDAGVGAGQLPGQLLPGCKPLPATCGATARTCASGSRQPPPKGSGTQPRERIILRYLERYGEGLCGHPVARDGEGRAVAVVDRTNNVIEQFFGEAKQGLRCRLGRAHLRRDMEDQPAPDCLGGEPAASGLRAGPVRHAGPIAPGLCPTGPSDLPADRPRLQRKNRNEKLRRRNRAWANQA